MTTGIAIPKPADVAADLRLRASTDFGPGMGVTNRRSWTREVGAVIGKSVRLARGCCGRAVILGA